MPHSKKIFLLLITLLLTACAGLNPAASNPAGMPIAAVSQAEATQTPPVYQPPADATATATPFQPLPPTPVFIPTDMPTPAPTAEVQEAPPVPELSGSVGLIEQPKGIVNILLLGSDARSRQKLFRTDTIILAILNTEKGTVSLLSFPRDLYVQIPGYGTDRINTAWQRGGFKTLAATLEHNFGLRIDHFVVINFSSFKKIIDGLGGLEVNVGEPLTDRYGGRGTITIKKGQQNMNADMVLWYVRSRKTSNDFARNRRQQEILLAVGQKMLTMDAIRRAPELYSAYKESVTTDLTLIDMLTFLPLAARLTDTSRIHNYFVSSHMVSDYITPGGAMVLLPQRDLIMNVIRKALKAD
jgi:LCP family protein required for cell wall assembly